MKKLALLTLFVIAPFAPAQVVLPPDKPKVTAQKFKAIAPVTVKAGEHIVIDAGSAKGEVDFIFDSKAFPPARATRIGNTLILSTNVNGSYVVNVVSYEDKETQRVAVKVDGGSDEPTIPDPPKPDDPLAVFKAEVLAEFAKINAQLKAADAQAKALHDRLASIESRVSALEKKPPVPTDPFAISLQSAYAADGRPADKLSKLAALYDLAGSIASDPANKTASAIFTTMRKAASIQLGEPSVDKVTVLPNVRQAIAAELNKTLPLGVPASTSELTPETRALIVTQFSRVAKALGEVTP